MPYFCLGPKTSVFLSSIHSSQENKIVSFFSFGMLWLSSVSVGNCWMLSQLVLARVKLMPSGILHIFEEEVACALA